MPRPPAPPCRTCGEKSRRWGFCEKHARQWDRAHARDRCTLCGTQTADPAGGQRRGRKWTTTGGTVITCRGCLPTFLEDRRPELLEALAAIVEPDPWTDAWLAKEATRNADGYGRLKVPGTREKVYAHHASYALFHGPWTAGDQIHHRTQDPAELSPWTLEAVPIPEHEQRKQLPPDRMPVDVPQLEALAEFARSYGLPLPWDLRRELATTEPSTHPEEEPAVVINLDTYRERREAEQAPAPQFKKPSDQDILAAIEWLQQQEGERTRAQLRYIRTGA